MTYQDDDRRADRARRNSPVGWAIGAIFVIAVVAAVFFYNGRDVGPQKPDQRAERHHGLDQSGRPGKVIRGPLRQVGGRGGKSFASAGAGFSLRSAINRSISPISRTWASMMSSASLRTRGSLMCARSLVRTAME